MAVEIRVSTNAQDIDEILADLRAREAPAATVTAINRALASVRARWTDLIYERYRARAIRRREISDQIRLDRARPASSKPEGRLRIRDRGMHLARFLPAGVRRRQAQYQSKGGWRNPAGKTDSRGRSRANQRTPRVQVAVLANAPARAIKGAFVWDTGSTQVLLRPYAKGERGPRGGRLETLYATTVRQQGEQVLRSEQLQRFADERFRIELERDVRRRVDARLARAASRPRPVQ